MFSLLAVLITILLVGSVLLWRTIRTLLRARPTIVRCLWRRSAGTER